MIWVLLWALGVVAFLVFLFWGHARWFLLWVLGLVGFGAICALQALVLEPQNGYRDIVNAAGRIGWGILILAFAVLATTLAVLIVLAIRLGDSEPEEGRALGKNFPLGSMSLRSMPLMGWSKRKVLGSKSRFITMESVVDGTATSSDRMIVLGVITLFSSFTLMWVGLGLILMKQALAFVLAPVPVGLWAYQNCLGPAWEGYRQAKRKLAAGQSGRVSK